VTVAGMDILIRKTESLPELEYMLPVENSALPQVTILGEPTVLITLPDGARSASLTHGKGPTPQVLEIDRLSGGKASLSVPLYSGRNKLALKTTLEWSESMEIPVGANVPILAWGLLATPATLDIQAFDLESPDQDTSPSHIRLKGPSVAANEAFRFRLASTKGAGNEEDLFTAQTDEKAESTDDSVDLKVDEDKGFPFVVLTPIFVVILAAIARKRRRS